MTRVSGGKYPVFKVPGKRLRCQQKNAIKLLLILDQLQHFFVFWLTSRSTPFLTFYEPHGFAHAQNCQQPPVELHILVAPEIIF